MKKRAIKVFSTSISLVLLAAFLPGCNRGPSDETLTQNVRTKLSADQSLATQVITVSTKDAIVTLAGTVNSDLDKNRAEQLTRSVEGVKSVNNNLQAKPVVIAQDDPLKTAVVANLNKYGITGIVVSVANGEVTLTGDLPRAKLQDAMKAANEAHPKKVNNKLNLK